MSVFDALDPSPETPAPWDAGLALLPELEALRSCEQDPVFHREGNVWIHTRAVVDKLWADERIHRLPRPRRLALVVAALLHDIAKPATRQLDADGGVHHPHHTTRGAREVERLLWQLGAPFAVRRLAVALVRHHVLPLRAFDRLWPERLVHAASLQLHCADLALLAAADVRGRECDDQQRLLDEVALFEQLCRDEGCATGPRAFPDAHSRVLYLAHQGSRATGRTVDQQAHDDTWGEVVVLAGLPGAGKSHLARTRWSELPVIEVDAIRRELGHSPRGKQGAVFTAARQRARELLRRRQPFVWSATSLSRRLRAPLIALCLGYRARVRIVYVEASPARLWQQNRARQAVVPEAAIRKMMGQWEVPTLVEAHAVEHLVDGVSQPDPLGA